MTKKATKYATPEQASKCMELAIEQQKSSAYIDNDDARAYVTTHTELCKVIIRAQNLMYMARYELELSNLLGEDVDNGPCPHFDKSFDYPMQAGKVRDEAVAMLQDANDIDRDTYEWLTYTYLYDLATI